MKYVNAIIESKADFERALDTPLTVFVVFVSPFCPSCHDALPRFVRMAAPYEKRVKVLILDCSKTPSHPAVDRVPMLLVYQKGVLQEAFAGLAEQSLQQAFHTYARAPKS